MGVNLSKGSKVSLAKVATEAGISSLKRVMVGLGWNPNQYDGGSDFDLDASVFLCGADGKVHKESNFVFYGNKQAPGVEHMGDNRTGAGDGDDEVINIDLSGVDSDVEHIYFTVTIYESDIRKQNFGMVSDSYIRIMDADSGVELLRYDLGEDYSIETALVVGDLYRHNGEWKFNAIGSGYSGGLEALCNSYGINV